MKIHKLLVSGLTAALLFGSASAALADTTNGSFEEGAPVGVFTSVFAGDSTSIPGWTVNTGNVDVKGTFWNASQGAKSVDLNGGEPGSISQTLSTIPGHTYSVTFDLSGNPGAPTFATMDVKINGVKVKDYSVNVQGKTLPNIGWVPTSFEFEATGSASVLTFLSTTPGSSGPAIDNVHVTDLDAVTPTPTVVPTATPTITPTPGGSDIPEACQGMTFAKVIHGTSGSDYLVGTSGSDLIFGYDGSDIIYGKGGSDCIVGGEGADTLYGSDGADVLLGNAGADYLNGGNDSDKLIGGEDSDYAVGGSGSNTCSAESQYQCGTDIHKPVKEHHDYNHSYNYVFKKHVKVH